MEIQKRLQDLERLLSDNMDKEYKFDEIYQKLLDERHIEDDFSLDSQKKLYLKNLNITYSKEAAMYQEMKRKRPNSNFNDEYNDFIKAFKQDVTDELCRLNLLNKLS